ncbi:helix-turn-helix transcriptional regulator [Aliikangiella maris]|uniref:Helix-turn-helix transcriptional regulator n=2 Tax=Aliikangiella maris TaxID=3162458 RepID=A0ABV2BZ83_9GAMM
MNLNINRLIYDIYQAYHLVDMTTMMTYLQEKLQLHIQDCRLNWYITDYTLGQGFIDETRLGLLESCIDSHGNSTSISIYSSGCLILNYCHNQWLNNSFTSAQPIGTKLNDTECGVSRIICLVEHPVTRVVNVLSFELFNEWDCINGLSVGVNLAECLANPVNRTTINLETSSVTACPLSLSGCPLSENSVKPSKYFSQNQMALIEAIVPHFIQAKNLNFTIQSAKEKNSQYMAMASRQGILISASSEFLACLAEEEIQWHEIRQLIPQINVSTDWQRIFHSNNILVNIKQQNQNVLVQLIKGGVIKKLTKKQYTIAMLLAKGYSYKEIARQQNIEPSTVTKHANNIYRNLNVTNKACLSELIYQ